MERLKSPYIIILFLNNDLIIAYRFVSFSQFISFFVCWELYFSSMYTSQQLPVNTVLC